MLKFLHTKQPHANFSTSAMETGDHSKNRVKSQTLMSRVKFKTLLMTISVCLFTINAYSIDWLGGGNGTIGNPWPIANGGGGGNPPGSTVYAYISGSTLFIKYTGSGQSNMADFWSSYGGEAPWNPNAPYYYPNASSITTVDIQNGVTNIGERAFKDLSSLQMITIPNSVTKINAQAFYNCTSLGNITLHDCITTVGGGAFHGCNILTVDIRKINPLAFDYANDNEYPFNGIYKLRVMPQVFNDYPSNGYIKEILYDEALAIPTYEEQSIIGYSYNCTSGDCRKIYKVFLTEGVIYNFRATEHWGGYFLYDNFGALLRQAFGGSTGDYQSPFTDEAYLIVPTCTNPLTIIYRGFLSTPTGITAQQEGNSISVSWNSVLGATNYVVYRSNSSSGTYTVIGTVSGTNFSDTSPLCGANYYRIEAHNSSTKSNLSNSAYVNFPVLTPTFTGIVTTYCAGATIPELPITSNNVISGTWSPPINNNTTTTYTFTPTAGQCANTFQITITVNVLPTITGTTPNSRCGSGTVTVGATASTGATIRWYATSTGGSILTTGTTYTTPSVSSTTTYYAEAYNSTTGCISSSRTAVTAMVNPVSTISLTTGTQNQTVCNGTAITNTVYTFGGSATNVTVSNLPAGLTQNVSTANKTVTISGTPTANGTYTITTSGHASPCTAVTITGKVEVNPIYTTPITASICQGESYDFFGEILTIAGTYSHILQTVHGCDSVIALTLTVNDLIIKNMYHEMCAGETYDFYGDILDSENVYQKTVPASEGCDTLVTLTLIVHPVYETPVAVSISEGNSYDFFGEILTESGDYSHTLSTIYGCDSVIMLTLTVDVGISDPIAQKLQIYPNPTNDEIFIKSELQIKKVEIYSITGALLLSESNFNEKISLSALTKGVYMAKIYTDNGAVVQKVVKE